MNTEYYRLSTVDLIDYRWQVRAHREKLEAALAGETYLKPGMDEEQRYLARRDILVSLAAVKGHERGVVRELKRKVNAAQNRLPGF